MDGHTQVTVFRESIGFPPLYRRVVQSRKYNRVACSVLLDSVLPSLPPDSFALFTLPFLTFHASGDSLQNLPPRIHLLSPHDLINCSKPIDVVYLGFNHSRRASLGGDVGSIFELKVQFAGLLCSSARPYPANIVCTQS